MESSRGVFTVPAECGLFNCFSETIKQQFHRSNKESPCPERAWNRHQPEQGTPPRRKPFRCMIQTALCHNPLVALPPRPTRNPPKSPPNFSPGGLCPHPALSAPFRIWVTVWVSPHPGGERRRADLSISSITNKNQPDLE